MRARYLRRAGSLGSPHSPEGEGFIAATSWKAAGKALRQHARLEDGPEGFMRAAAKQMNLSGRGFDRILRVARTVADLAGAASISEAHLAEAVSYRQRDW